MMPTISNPTDNYYRLSENLENHWALTMAGDASGDEVALTRLGSRNWGRLYQFRHSYSSGWGEARSGRPLSPRALELFYRFLVHINFPAGSRPSLFMTNEGTLELCWDDSSGKPIQVEFTPSGAELYWESRMLEHEVSIAGIIDLAKTLNG
jgi:hypothetical protein